MSTLPIVLLCGQSNVPFAQMVAQNLSKLYGTEIKCHVCAQAPFSNGETHGQIPVSVRGCDVYVLQSTCSLSPNDSCMELYAIIQAAHLSDAARVTAFVPALAYARQDRKAAPREPISAKLACKFIKESGASRLMTFDLHADQIQGFFDGPVDNLYGVNYFVMHVLSMFQRDMARIKKECVIVSPDAGGMKRAEKFANLLGGLDVAVIHKTRSAPGQIGSMKLIGQEYVTGRLALLIDDIADTCGTLSSAAKLLKENGALRTIAYATHGVLSGNAFATLEKAAEDLDFRLIVSDTINVEANMAKKGIKPQNLTILSFSEMTAVAIQTANKGGSLSRFYDLAQWCQLFEAFHQ